MEIDNLVGSLYQENKSIENSKFGYAYKRFVDKNYVPTLTEYNKELVVIRVDYKYSKQELVNVIKAEDKLQEKYGKIEIEIIPFISVHVPELSEELKERLTGLVL